MSWWSDGEKFDEYDPPWCRYCEGGNSKAQCDACTKRHLNDKEDDDDTE